METRGLTIGVDVGGSFTDVVVSDGRHNWRAKAPTVPDDCSAGVLVGCDLVAAQLGLDLATMLPRVRRFGLGTTAVTNALTVHRGTRVGLLTTKGFEHAPLLARGRRSPRDGWLEMPWTPLRLRLIGGVEERIGRCGVVIRPLNEDDVARQVERLVESERVEALAISFLWSFCNPAHETRAAEIARAAYPALPVFAGSALQPAPREYERTMLTVMNAFCASAIDGIGKLDDQLRALGLKEPILLLQASGGTTTLQGARSAPVSLAASGPAAGVGAAAEVAAASGHANVICGDMGGTSFDVGLILGGQLQRRQRGEIHGVMMAQPHVEVRSIGAGGGSIAWIDSRGLLRIGPQSAGAYPGPACYGRGGTEPTVTDAMLLLGYLDPAEFLGGSMPLDVEASRRACERVGRQARLGILETAWGIRELAITAMVNAMRAHVGAAGADPRKLVAMTYGGSGSLFMAEIATRVGVPRFLAPELASVLSAYGAASADIRIERMRAMGLLAPVDQARVAAAIEDLDREVLALLADRGAAAADCVVQVEGDFRFARQSWELSIAIDGGGVAKAADDFVEAYGRRYGVSSLTGGVPVELVALRVIGLGATIRASLPTHPSMGHNRPASSGHRKIRTARAHEQDVPVFPAVQLTSGDEITGPALVVAADNTLWIPLGAVGVLDERRSMHVELAPGTA